MSRINPPRVVLIDQGPLGAGATGTDYSPYWMSRELHALDRLWRRFRRALAEWLDLPERVLFHDGTSGRNARIRGLVAPGACAGYSLGSSPAEIASVLLGVLGLAVVAYVAVPVLKTLGRCWSARIEARFMPSRRRPCRCRRTQRRRRA
jgi:hypothetical protein